VVSNFIIVDVIVSSCAAARASNSAGGPSPRAWWMRALLKPAAVFDDGELELGA
jgi:hypothetical protein